MEFSHEQIEILGLGLSLPAPIVQTTIATMLGAILGLEREWKQKVASIRTFALISGGSAFYSCLSLVAAGNGAPGQPYDTTRVAAGIVTGIGFLGGGVIYKNENGIEGITTGAMIWFVAAIGMACGFNQLDLAFWAVVLFIATVVVSKPLYDLVEIIRRKMGYEDEVESQIIE